MKFHPQSICSSKIVCLFGWMDRFKVGLELRSRLLVDLGFIHKSDPRHAILILILHGEDVSAILREVFLLPNVL